LPGFLGTLHPHPCISCNYIYSNLDVGVGVLSESAVEGGLV